MNAVAGSRGWAAAFAGFVLSLALAAGWVSAQPAGAVPAKASEAAPAAPKAPVNPPAPATPPVAASEAALASVAAAAVAVAAVLAIVGVLRNNAPTGRSRGWSLADALSEDVTFVAADGSKTTLLVASSSRLIAMVGFVVLVCLFASLGVMLVFSFGATGRVPDDAEKLLKFLAGGAALFVPYLANQLRGAIESKTASAETKPKADPAAPVPPLGPVPPGPKV